VKIEADSNDTTGYLLDVKRRPHLCTVCEKRFTTKAYLNSHIETHTGALLYSCTQCEKWFVTQRYLRKHMVVHSSKYKCTECGKCFRDKQKLTTHKRSHSGEKPFECTVCSRCFSRSDDLARHCRIHTGEKPHRCITCDKAFIQSGELTAHIRVHTGHKPYKWVFNIWQRFQPVQPLALADARTCRDPHSNIRRYDCCCCGKMFKGIDVLKRHVCTQWCKAILM